MEILRTLRTARWLTTGQVHRRYFPQATLSAARRRLRLLAAAGYAKKHQENPMREALATLGRESKRLLEASCGKEVVLERNPPKQLEHLIGINDIRIAAELTPDLGYFFAAWELPGAAWKQAIIPDAVFRRGEGTFAVEYDRGLENLKYFVGSKIAAYRRGLPGFPLAGVLIVVDSESRARTLRGAIGEDPRVSIALLSTIRAQGITGVIAGNCSSDPFSRENGSDAGKSPVSRA